MLLKALCTCPGVSGDESRVRAYIAAQLAGMEMATDAMGNLLVSRTGKGKKILLAAHMDEVGLLISDVTENGFLHFKIVGGIHTDVLLGKKVYIGEKNVAGIIGICAVHLQDKAAREGVVKPENLYIDIGASDKNEALSLVSPSDYAAFAPNYTEFGDGRIVAKAIDDRAGCALLVRLLKTEYSNVQLCGAFTAQEETGTRGAGAAAEYFRPDAAIIVETTFCAEIFPTEESKHVTTIGKGPALTFMDRTATPDRALMATLTDIADANHIPWQYKRTTGGGTDAGTVSRAAGGIPTAILALPCRNLHSPSCVIAKEDYENMYRLLYAWLSNGAVI